MRVSKAWLAEYVTLRDGDATTGLQIAADLVRVGLEEEAIHGGEVTGPVVVGRLVEVTPEPQKNGKVVNWCQVDVGAEFAPEAGGPRGIVCGAPNVAVGRFVVVALPGAVLPGDFAISGRKTYGHLSDGMICSARELGLGQEHDGIIVLPGFLGVDESELTPGQDALPLLGLDAEVVEVNVTPDRGYCFSVRGVAREYASAVGRPEAFRDPAALPVPAPTAGAFEVRVADTAPLHGQPGCDRFVTRIVRGVDPAAPSPAWLRQRVEQAGMRSISLVVDVTNYVMLGLGQPMHAYDLATLTGPVTVRRAQPGERLTTLDGVDRALHPEDLLITDAAAGSPGSRVIGLAGVMGGAATEISDSTTDILLEAAHFDAASVARTARRHKLPSEAAKRFERGVDPAVAAPAAQLAVDLLVEHGGGTADPAVGDLDQRRPVAAITMAAGEPTRLVGVRYEPPTVLGRLREIGCEVSGEDPLTVTPPSWRPDLTQPADLVEEVARLEGYDRIPSVLPVAPAGRGLTRSQRVRRVVVRGLVDRGFDEVWSYPFVAESLFDALGLAADDSRRQAVRLANPLSDEQPLMRTEVLQTLLEVLRRNVSRGSTDLALVEIGSVTTLEGPVRPGQAPVLGTGSRPAESDLHRVLAGVPPQTTHLAGVAVGHAVADGWWGKGRLVDAADAIEAARFVLARAGAEAEVTAARTAPWHPSRCAALSVAGTVVGHAGELHPRVVEGLGLPARTVAFEVDLDAVVGAATGETRAVPVSPFGVVKEDVALVVPVDVPAGEVQRALRRGGGDLLESVRLFDVYSGDQVGSGNKSLAFALRMRAADRTLKAAETAAVRQAAVDAAAAEFGAVLRGA